jgi:hypothetical protein
MAAEDYWDGSIPGEEDEPNIYPKRHKCSFCGTEGLKWKQFGLKYKLISQENETVHVCNRANAHECRTAHLVEKFRY